MRIACLGAIKVSRFGRQSRQDEKRSRAYVSETITVRMDEFVHPGNFLQTIVPKENGVGDLVLLPSLH